MKNKKLALAFRILKKEGFLKLASGILGKYYQKQIENYKKYLPYFKDRSGLEIGGPSIIFKKFNLLPIYTIIKSLDGCNFRNETVWEGKITEGQTYNYYMKGKAGYQYICDAVDLIKIKSETYDFILSSHNIEHLANPFKALSEWLRVIKEDGVLLLVVPHKDGTFDHNRPVTNLKHLIDDFEKDIKEDDLTHLAEALDLHDYDLDFGCKDKEEFKKRSEHNFQNRCLHQHVYNTELVAKIFDHFNLQIISIDIVMPYHIFVLGKKMGEGEKANNSLFIGKDAFYKHNATFPSDKL